MIDQLFDSVVPSPLTFLPETVVLITEGLPFDLTERELRAMFRFAPGYLESGLIDEDDPLAAYLITGRAPKPVSIEVMAAERRLSHGSSTGSVTLAEEPLATWPFGPGSNIFTGLAKVVTADPLRAMLPEPGRDPFEGRTPFIAYAIFDNPQQAAFAVAHLSGKLYYQDGARHADCSFTAMAVKLATSPCDADGEDYDLDGGEDLYGDYFEEQAHEHLLDSVVNVRTKRPSHSQGIPYQGHLQMAQPNQQQGHNEPGSRAKQPSNNLNSLMLAGSGTSSVIPSRPSSSAVNGSAPPTGIPSIPATPTTMLWCENPPCNTLYIGNLPPSTQPLELYNLFSPLMGFKRMSFREKVGSGPMCFVEFSSIDLATQAMMDMYGRMLSGSTKAKGGIRLSYSKNPLGVRKGSLGSSLSTMSTPSSMAGNGQMDASLAHSVIASIIPSAGPGRGPLRPAG